MTKVTKFGEDLSKGFWAIEKKLEDGPFRPCPPSRLNRVNVFFFQNTELPRPCIENISSTEDQCTHVFRSTVMFLSSSLS